MGRKAVELAFRPLPPGVVGRPARIKGLAGGGPLRGPQPRTQVQGAHVSVAGGKGTILTADCTLQTHFPEYDNCSMVDHSSACTRAQSRPCSLRTGMAPKMACHWQTIEALGKYRRAKLLTQQARAYSNRTPTAHQIEALTVGRRLRRSLSSDSACLKWGQLRGSSAHRVLVRGKGTQEQFN